MRRISRETKARVVAATVALCGGSGRNPVDAPAIGYRGSTFEAPAYYAIRRHSEALGRRLDGLCILGEARLSGTASGDHAVSSSGMVSHQYLPVGSTMQERAVDISMFPPPKCRLYVFYPIWTSCIRQLKNGSDDLLVSAGWAMADRRREATGAGGSVAARRACDRIRSASQRRQDLRRRTRRVGGGDPRWRART